MNHGKNSNVAGSQRRDSELTKLAERHIEKRDERMAIGKKEVELKQQLITMMKNLKRRAYFDEEANLSITLESKASIKVKVGSDEDDDAAD